MPYKKTKRSGRSMTVEVSFLNGRWERAQVHGHDVWVEAKHQYERHSPRAWALSWALRALWTQNRNTPGLTWRETVNDLRLYIRGVGRISKADFEHAKAILRECGKDHYDEEGGDRFVYFCERGPSARCGFTLQPTEAAKYEERVHTELRVREGRVAAGTVEAAGEEFAIPVRTRSLKTRVLNP